MLLRAVNHWHGTRARQFGAFIACARQALGLLPEYVCTSTDLVPLTFGYFYLLVDHGGGDATY
jgi:hypothetical protein